MVVCLLGALVVGLACQQRSAGRGTQSASKSAKTESENPVQKTEDLKLPLKEPRIVVFKSKRQLELYSDGALVRIYRVGLGLNPVDDKQREGDRATPEGEFYIFTKNPKSAYYLSLGISYPIIEDAERGLRTGLITLAQHDQIVSAIKRSVRPLNILLQGVVVFLFFVISTIVLVIFFVLEVRFAPGSLPTVLLPPVGLPRGLRIHYTGSDCAGGKAVIALPAAAR